MNTEHKPVNQELHGPFIDGVFLSRLSIIEGENGNVMHALKASHQNFAGFGEAYFSTVKKGSIKGWKRHSTMTLTIVVPVGGIRFVIYDDRAQSPTFQQFNEFRLGPLYHYARLTVSPNLWMAFQGMEEGVNLLLNLASVEHDPNEVRSLPLENNQIPQFNW